MRCQGKFVYKGLQKVDGGSFIDGSGKKIDYSSSYKLKLDEWNDDNLNEVKIKIPESNIDLINKLKVLKPYQEIILDYNIVFYNSVPKVVPIDFKVDSNNK